MIELTNLEIITRLLVAAVLGSIVGFERESKGQDAGFRTHILVSLGAAIFTIIQLEAVEFVAQIARENPDMPSVISSDVTRLISQVVSGIGFLGAGTIIVSNRTVKGLTTAASIWAIASIGMAAGFGQYFLAVSGTIIILIVLQFVQGFFQLEEKERIRIKYGNRSKTLPIIKDCFLSYNLTIIRVEFYINLEERESPVAFDTFVLSIPKGQKLDPIIEELMQIDDLYYIASGRSDVKVESI